MRLGRPAAGTMPHRALIGETKAAPPWRGCSDPVNDQHPFDITPDDEHRATQDEAQQTAPERARLDTSPAAVLEADDRPTGAPEALPTHKHRRRLAALGVAAAVIFTTGAGGGAVASLALARSATATADAGTGSTTQDGASGQAAQNGYGSGVGGFGRFGSGDGSGSASGTGTSTSTATTATTEQLTGLVTIDTQLGYEDGEAAGTGIILTSSGRILTNNHVIDGATSIKVTVEPTGKSYTADVVGTDATKDIAVLQLENASGLTAADLATSTPSTGDTVTAVGNANGTGTLSAAEGTVAALDQTITTSSEGSTTGETLNGLIELDADVISGDSGGAVENTDGDVVGVTTAASSGTAQVTGYAIPITTAVSIAQQIVAGDDTAEITIGLPAFLGVALSTDSDGAVVGSVLAGTAAAKTDLAAGDTITAIGGTTITSADELSAAIAEHAVGDAVTIHYTDSNGVTHTATVTLAAGPAD